MPKKPVKPLKSSNHLIPLGPNIPCGILIRHMYMEENMVVITCLTKSSCIGCIGFSSTSSRRAERFIKAPKNCAENTKSGALFFCHVDLNHPLSPERCAVRGFKGGPGDGPLETIGTANASEENESGSTSTTVDTSDSNVPFLSDLSIVVGGYGGTDPSSSLSKTYLVWLVDTDDGIVTNDSEALKLVSTVWTPYTATQNLDATIQRERETILRYSKSSISLLRGFLSRLFKMKEDKATHIDLR